MELYPYELEHLSMLRRLAPECVVLLKKDGSFPLDAPCQIALYGSGARRTIKGGTGSGDVNVRHYSTVEEGLEKMGFTITTKEWLDGYDAVWEQAHRAFVDCIKAKAKETGVPAIVLGMGAVMPEPEYTLPLTGEGDTAVYVLSRISGEGSDRKPVPGDLMLTQTEVRDILYLAGAYRRFLLVLNVGGVVDLSLVDGVSNIMLLSQLGMTVGDTLADLLLGKVYPSGKLTTTWAAKDAYCQIGDFGECDDTRYREGIYVGYRYFDSVGRMPLYPFGFGLGYTDFSIQDTSIAVSGAKVTVHASVKNTGDFVGREVLQVYVSVPAGKLDQPYQSLAAFAKTQELKPGQTESITTEFALEDLASFDTDRAASVLEAGDYLVRVGNSSRNTHVCGVIRLPQEVVIAHLHNAGGDSDFIDWKPERASHTDPRELEEIHAAPIFLVSSDVFCELKITVPAAHDTILALLETLTDSELAYLCTGNFRSDNDKDSIIGNAGIRVAGSAGETCGRFEHLGIPGLVMADGPAGLRLDRKYGKDEKGVYPVNDGTVNPLMEYIDADILQSLGVQTQTGERNGTVYDQYCSAIPIGTALAQSWNTALGEECGNLIGSEMERFGIQLWLAPALNIHRNILCGRNFEYYSEDPLLSGRMAAAMTVGVQKHPGCGVTIKHYACNNQETNRFRSNSIVSQRALRDIYLRGFKVAVTEARPCAVMTSYNLLNGEHTSQRRDLNVEILRKEWGFTGLIMSDWVTSGLNIGRPCKYPYACAPGSIRAGNDVMMPGSELDHANLLAALRDENHPYHLTRENLVECAAHVVTLVQELRKGNKHESNCQYL